MKQTLKMQENRQRLDGKTIIGIDPAKSKHQAVVLGVSIRDLGGKPCAFRKRVLEASTFERLPR